MIIIALTTTAFLSVLHYIEKKKSFFLKHALTKHALTFFLYCYNVQFFFSCITEYTWAKESPIQLKQELAGSLPSFELEAVNTTYCTSKTATGSYSCLRVVLDLKRQFRYSSTITALLF